MVLDWLAIDELVVEPLEAIGAVLDRFLEAVEQMAGQEAAEEDLPEEAEEPEAISTEIGG